MKPLKPILVFLIIAALLLSSGCGAPQEGPPASEPSKTLSDSFSDTSAATSDKADDMHSASDSHLEASSETEASEETKPVTETLFAIYLGSSEYGQLRFFTAGQEISLFPADTMPSEDPANPTSSKEPANPFLMEGSAYTISFSEDSLLQAAPATLTSYTAPPEKDDVHYWSVGLFSKGVFLTEANEPEIGAIVLVAETEDRTDVYLPLPHIEITPALEAEKDLNTRKNILMTAFAPLGTTLYVPGGTASGPFNDANNAVNSSADASSENSQQASDSNTIQPPALWADFFFWQDDTYDYSDWGRSSLDIYQYCGTDSAGYITWVLENALTFEESLPKDDTLFASLEALGLGTITQLPENMADTVLKDLLLPGDLIQVGEEFWLVLGHCPDSSTVVFRCAPSPSHNDRPGGGVQLSAVGSSGDCLAYRLAKQIMEGLYSEWSARYDVELFDPLALQEAPCFTWGAAILTDPDGLSSLSARQIVTALFGRFPVEQEGPAAQVTVDPSWFDNALFLGDSITEHLRMYCVGNGVLGNAQFLSSSSLSPVNALWDISSISVHPKINGTKVRVEDGIALKKPQYVYIMLGINSISLGIDWTLSDLETLIDLILAKSPDVTILMQSVTPMTETSTIKSDSLNNDVINEYNARLQELCAEHGWYFINVAEVMKNENGDMIFEYCSDGYDMGIHMTNLGAEVWINYLLTHVPEDLT